MWIFPTMTSKPPTLYSIMNSIVNYDREEQIKISELSKYARTTIFDFEYPLSENVDKETFEVNILNHYMERRIGFDTPTAFKVALNSKLNEIMPYYNLMFEALNGWELFNAGEVVSRSLTDDTTSSIDSESHDNTITDLRSSNMPENRLNDIRNGTYVSEYNYNQNDTNSNSSSDGTTNKSVAETISRTPADKIRILTEFKEKLSSIYTLIYKDLDLLFYGIL